MFVHLCSLSLRSPEKDEENPVEGVLVLMALGFSFLLGIACDSILAQLYRVFPVVCSVRFT